jgi:hypothetical protein
MKKRAKQIINRFRADNPLLRGWSDERVIDAMFRIAAQQYPSKIAKISEGRDGMAIFRIPLTSDASDDSA